MAIVTYTAIVLECDGCKTIFRCPPGIQTATDLRAIAYGEGWRFPHQVGPRSGKAVKTTSDVCPGCISGWTPQTRAERNRSATRDESAGWVS